LKLKRRKSVVAGAQDGCATIKLNREENQTGADTEKEGQAMKAVVINKFGGNDVVELRDMPNPVAGPGQVLIRVRAASVNPSDWKIRRGMFKSRLGNKFPLPLGRECSGEVVETGSNVTRFKKGDQVVAVLNVLSLGSFAEYVAVPEQSVFSKPANISFEEATTIPIAGLTALRSLRDAGGIKKGMKVAVIGAAGGVGHFAIQIAKVFGAEVTAVNKSIHADFVKSLGADKVIDYTKEDFTRGGEKYDIVFDAVTKRSFAECKHALTDNGVYVSTLPISGPTQEQGKQAKTVSGGPTQEDMQWMKERIEEGRIKIAVKKVFPLDHAGDALAESETGQVSGKLVLKAA
jgi:NADPH:quinone reductase-like Zn-dependent oxidoreductase